MHELAITQSLLDTASDYAIKNNAKRVITLNLVIGDLSGIIDDSVQFYWDFVSKDTVCAKSQLVFEHRKAYMKCSKCGHEFHMDDDLTPCPNCSSISIKVLSGDEFRLDSIEIET